MTRRGRQRHDTRGTATAAPDMRGRRSVRWRTYLALFVTLAVVLAVSLAALAYASRFQLAESERDNGVHTMQRAVYAVASELDTLDSLASDWATWDDAYHFMAGTNQAFVRANLPSQILSQLHLDVMMFVDPSGKVVWVDALARDGGRLGVAPPTLVSQLADGGLIGKATSLASSQRGVVMLGDTPLLVVTAPILTSRGEGPAHGVIVTGRTIDATLLSRLSRLADAPLAIASATASAASKAVGGSGTESQLTSQAPVVAQVASDLSVSGQALLSDVAGRPAFILSSAMPPADLGPMLRIVALFSGLMLLVGSGGIVLAIAIVERTSLSRISWLQSSIARIGTLRNRDARIVLPADGPRDEVWAVAVETNRTLDALESVERAYDEKQRFFANASHELRTPLNSIIGFSTVLGSGMPGPLNEEQQRQIEMVRDSGHSLLALVNDLLDLGKLESTQADYQLDEVDVDELAALCMQRLVPLAEQRGLELYLTPGSAGHATMDRRRVEQVVTNLVGNAIKFTDTGSVEVATSSEDGAVRIEVTDTGQGVDPKVLPRVFDEFVSTVDRRPHGGTGLGLAICREIANAHGGDITVATIQGEGSRFSLTVPRVPHCSIRESHPV